MNRFKLLIEYDGGPFVGWQMQNNGVSVQGQLLGAINQMTGEDALPNGAGRTDAGVHARGQVAHVDLSDRWEAAKLREGLNYHLKPDPICILNVERVTPEFDARFSATMRHYQYVIINRRAPLALDRLTAYHVPHPLDVGAMNEAAQELIGTHDFTTFRSVHCQAKSPKKSIDQMGVSSEGDRILIVSSARSFMHNQVRSISGSLIQVGLGKWSVADFKSALAAMDRSRCGTVAPAHGLYLMGVDY